MLVLSVKYVQEVRYLNAVQRNDHLRVNRVSVKVTTLSLSPAGLSTEVGGHPAWLQG